MLNLQKRRHERELMDDRSIGGTELREALGQLRWINFLLGAARPTCEGVDRLWRQAGRPTSLSLIDVGAGSGEQNRWLLRWARRHGIDLQITLLDIHPETCDEARRYYAYKPEVQVVQGDLLDLKTDTADIVTASLVMHHFSCTELPAALLALQRAARLGVVVNDLHRHWLAWAFIRLATRALSANRMIRNDAPLSVQRGFQREDFTRLKQSHPGLSGLQVMWRPLFRYLVLLPAGRGEADA